MDLTILSIFATLILIIISLIFIKIKNSSNSDLPPGKFGWPIYGETIEYITHPEKFMRDRMSKYNPEIFKTSVLGENVVFLCGPNANKFIFSNEGKLFKFWMPSSLASALSGPNVDKNSISSQFAMETLHKFLRLDSLQLLIPVMDSKAREYFDIFWAPYEIVKVHPLTKEFTFMLTCYLSLNYGKQEKVKEVAKPFFDFHEGTMSKKVSLPFYSAKNQESVQNKIVSVIKERKLELVEDRYEDNEFVDFLTRVLVDSKEKGVVLNEDDVAAKINTLLFASFYTISTTLTFIVYYLADYPQVYDKVLQEHLEIAEGKEEGELLNWRDIQKMKYSWSIACEAMRLRPPALGSFREALTDFTYAGFRVPKGWKVAWNVYASHKDPKYFSEAEKFDATRFEGTKNALPPYAFVPFGGGPLMCGGKEFARIEILTFMYNLVTRFKFSKVNPKENILYTPAPTPAEGLPIRLQKFDIVR